MTIKGYRTIIFNVLAGIPLLAESLLPILSLPELAALIPDAWLPYYGLFVAMGNVWLRSITTTPVGRSE